MGDREDAQAAEREMASERGSARVHRADVECCLGLMERTSDRVHRVLDRGNEAGERRTVDPRRRREIEQ